MMDARCFGVFFARDFLCLVEFADELWRRQFIVFSVDEKVDDVCSA